MTTNENTCWTLIRSAAAGNREARSDFTRRYLPVVRAYLAARWAGSPLIGELDDAVQEVFLDCLRQGGVLERADPASGSGFRAFLFGVARTVALHFETRRAREWQRREDSSFHPDQLAAAEARLSRVFDRAWARSVMREAAELQAAQAQERGEPAVRRVELLRLRFHEGLPIRDIARLWNVDPARLHHEFAQARKEFAEALREVVGLCQGCSRERLEEECSRLQELL